MRIPISARKDGSRIRKKRRKWTTVFSSGGTVPEYALVKWRIVRNIKIVGPVVYVFRRPISPRYCKALIDVLPQFIRLFKPTNSDNENIWRQENPAILVHWDM